MQTIGELASRHDLVVVEDACQATGATIGNKLAGTWGNIGVLSFGGSKLVTSGRGGALLTNDAQTVQRIKVFCERGNDAFPLSELQAAVLLPQLARLHQQNARRATSVERLRSKCAGLDRLRMIAQPANGNVPSYYKVAFMLDAEALRVHSRDDFVRALRAEGIAIDAGFRGFTKRSQRRCRRVGKLANSEAAAEGTLVLHHPVLLETPETIDRVAHGLWKVAQAFSGK
jgi:dTDP-4-amino-4,6-dideoxygalactose transaminase